jgi:ABC-type oligopeptide transport system substrate-binding subunit
MNNKLRWILLVLFVSSLALSACGPAKTSNEKVAPSTVEKVEGSEFSRVTLTEKAAIRIDVQTAAVQTMAVNGSQFKVIPYAAVMYGLDGQAWTYTNPEPLVFVRQTIVINYIEGDLAVLSEGPEVGTLVVIVGAPLLYGAEVGVSK